MFIDKIVLEPVYKEISADVETPVSVFLALRQNYKKCFLLESVEMGEKLGRYSFIGFNPFFELTIKNNSLSYRYYDKTETMNIDNPIIELKKIINSFEEINKNENLPPFTAGLVGYFSYDSIKYFEKIKLSDKDTLKLPDINFMVPEILIAFDHIKGKLIIITYKINGRNNNNESLIKEIEEKIYNAKQPSRIMPSVNTKISMTSNFKKEKFLEAVKKAKDYIIAGDIFQVVLSQRFKTEINIDPFNIYRKLRMINPSPYMFYLDFEDFQLIGSSPEVMSKRIKKEGKDMVIVNPIAGTRPRGKTKEEDEELEKNLLNDQKELAEHTMLVDLARNDVGKISKYNTVKVENPYHIERYSHVMHIVTDVIGEPRDDIDNIEIIKSTFPAGTVSGAPKIRAMEIISELEPDNRGVYAGAIGYIDFNGNYDTCIAIRTIVYKNNIAYIQAGAGIVFDSDPLKEYEETINKAKALMRALI